MIRTAIFTAGKAGKRILDILRRLENIEVKYFVDNNANRYADYIENIRIVSPYTIKKELDMGKIDFILVPSDRIISYGLREYTAQLDSLKIMKYKIIPSWMIRKEIIDDSDVKKMLRIIESKEYRKINQLQHLQFHVIDNCNLNCKRCQHFSNIANKDSFASYDDIKRDFDRLQELFDDIRTIAILGGEPLLNPELPKYCYMIHEHFEHAQIEIITNGILVRQMNSELVRAVRENNVLMNISYYPILDDIIEDIVKFLKTNDMHFHIGNRISEFSKRLTLEKQTDDINEKYMLCRDSCCTTLRNGKIYPCYLPATVHVFNDTFRQNIDMVDEGINIYQQTVTGEFIVERLKTPFEICKHCGIPESYPWELTKIASKNDWLIGEERCSHS